MFNCQAANKWKSLIKLSRGKKTKKKLHNRHLGWHRRKSQQHMMSYFSHVKISFSSNLTWTHLSRAGLDRYCVQLIWGGSWKQNGVRLSDRYANHIPYFLPLHEGATRALQGCVLCLKLQDGFYVRMDFVSQMFQQLYRRYVLALRNQKIRLCHRWQWCSCSRSF